MIVAEIGDKVLSLNFFIALPLACALTLFLSTRHLRSGQLWLALTLQTALLFACCYPLTLDSDLVDIAAKELGANYVWLNHHWPWTALGLYALARLLLPNKPSACH